MDCRTVEQLLSQRAFAELGPDDRAVVEAHLADCAPCRGRWDSALQSQELYEVVKPQRDATAVRDAVLARLDGQAPRQGPQSGNGETPARRQRLGGFELLGRLGHGGMGTVLKARQITMDRLVALKILPRKLAANEDFVKRFIREARAAAKLRHPNIVQAYDAGKAEGYFYFAMEYVEGETLQAILQSEGSMEPSRAVAAMKQVCSALAAAHAAGIVHRDIKPSNIMLDRQGEVRVMDFGLAKRTEGDIAVTADGKALGTPAYVSPEMASGKEADARSDLYSLGATFFHVLAGRPPFQGATHSEVVIKHVNQQAPPLGELAAHVDPRLCAIIDRLLRKDPAERYPSAQALLAELANLGELQPAAGAQALATLRDAPTVPLSPGQRMLREFQAQERHEGLGRSARRTILLACGAGALLAAVGVLAWVATRPGPSPQGDRGQPATTTSTHVGLVDPRERGAEAAWRNAQVAAQFARWRTVIQHLDELRANYADTTLYARNRIAIDKLRTEAEAKLPPPHPDTRTMVQPRPPPPVPIGEWVPLFDGRTLNGWRIGEEGIFAEHGQATVEGGQIVLGGGRQCTGVAWTGGFPATDYELELEATRLEAKSCLVSLVVPVGDADCVLGVGPWGTQEVGLTFFDGREAHWNPTRRLTAFETGRPYRVRLRVTEARVEGWIDAEQVLDVPRRNHVFLLPRGGFGCLRPFGLFVNGVPRSAYRDLRLRPLEPQPGAPPRSPADGERFPKAVVAVHARALWADTGLYVEKGSIYRLTASGRWGGTFNSTHGPEGDATKLAPRPAPLPGAPACALIGRIGKDGAPFLVGAERAVVPEESGWLLLMSNSASRSHCWGTVRVTVEGPLVAHRSAQLLSRFTRELGRVTVSARQTKSTEVAIAKGEVLLVEAEGQWSTGAQACDADGVDKISDRLRLGMLVAALGRDGGPHMVGRFCVLEPFTSGTLHLSMHDPDRKDNTGSVAVTLRAFEPPPPRDR